MRQWGNVQNAEKLLEKKSLQISTSEKTYTCMENKGRDENASVLLDFGLEFSGGARILTFVCEGESYPEVRLCFGESASEALSSIGYKNAENDHSVRDMDIRLASLSDMEFGQTGYRFLKIELRSQNTKILLKSILGVFSYRELDYQGSFECNDERINKIYDVAAYTCHLNMQSMLWDGIKRDRLVWIGDMHPEMLTIRTVFGYNKVIDEGLEFSVQQDPLPRFPNNMVTYSMWWLIIIRDWYMYHGNMTLVQKYENYITNLIKQLCGYIADDGSDSLSQFDTGYFLDWQSFYKPQAIAGVRALFALSLSAGAQLCTIMNNMELKKLCEEKNSCLTKKIPKEYNMKQVAAMMCLAGHLDARNAAEEVLIHGGAKGMSTFMSYYILSSLANAGKTQQALKILSDYYGGMLDVGATTFWEDFDVDWLKASATIDQLPKNGEYDIHGDNGAHCYIGYRHSLCHGWSSGPVPFLAENVLGVKILEPGCKKIEIIPQLGGLEWVKGCYPTPYGIVQISHERTKDGSVKTEYTAPDEIEVILGGIVSR